MYVSHASCLYTKTTNGHMSEISKSITEIKSFSFRMELRIIMCNQSFSFSLLIFFSPFFCVHYHISFTYKTDLDRIVKNISKCYKMYLFF